MGLDSPAIKARCHSLLGTNFWTTPLTRRSARE